MRSARKLKRASKVWSPNRQKKKSAFLKKQILLGLKETEKRWKTYSYGLAVFIVAFLAAFFASSLFGAPRETQAEINTSDSVSADGYTLSLSATSAINLDLSLFDNDSMTVALGNVNVQTNSPGYRLYIGMKNDSTSLNGLEHGASREISGVEGTFDAPVSLTSGSWGYAIPSNTAHLATGNFSANYGTMGSSTPDDTKLFATPPASSQNPQMIAYSSTATPAGGDIYPIYYGIRANAAADPGEYNAGVLFTAIADANTQKTLTATPNSLDVNTSSTISVKTSLYSTATAEAHVYFLTTAQYNSIVGTDVEDLGIEPLDCPKTSATPLTFSCNITAPEDQGIHYFYVKSAAYDMVYDTTFAVNNPVTLTVNPNGGSWSGSTSPQSFTQNEDTTKVIEAPTGPAYTISYNDNGQGATFTPSPNAAYKSFDEWDVAGGGVLSGTTYTFGSENGTLTASYNEDAAVTLPVITRTDGFCGWAKDSASGSRYSAGDVVDITANTTFYAVCQDNPDLTVDPKGGTWNGSTSAQTFTQSIGSTKTIANPTAPTYTISYNDNGQSATFTPSPTSLTPTFSAWSLNGAGTWNASTGTYTFGSGNATLSATYQNSSITLPAISKTNYNCQWAKDSATGTKYNGGASVAINANTTFYAVCTIKPKLTVNPNGGTWSSSTSSQDFYNNANATKSIANPTGPTHTIAYNDNSQGATYTGSPTSATRAFSSWTHSGGGTWNASTTTYTFGTTNGTLTATYNASVSIALPAISKTNYNCQWAKDSATGTKYNGGASVAINANTTFYTVCTIKPKLTVNPNGGTWSGSTSSQSFYQNANTTKTVANPTGPSITIRYEANNQGATYTGSPTSATKAFSSWTKGGGGSISGTTYTFGSTDGTLTANYASSVSITLPGITKDHYTCQWAKDSATGTKYNGGASVALSGNTTFYAVCTINTHTLTINPNGGTWNNKTANSTITQAYGSTYTVADATGPAYTVSFNDNSQSSGATLTAKKPTKAFSSWTKGGTGTFNTSTKVWTYGDGNGSLTANFSSTSVSFTLPTFSKAGYSCKWAKGSASSTTKYDGGASITVTGDTTFYAVCTINQYTLTINPSGGKWNGTTANSTVTQNYNTTKTIADPTNGPTYTAKFNDNSQSSGATLTDKTPARAFTSWTKGGTGSFNTSTKVWTFGAGNGTLTANWNTTSASFALPTFNKAGYNCQWAKGSATGTKYNGGASVTITANTTFFAVCTAKTYTVTLNKNGGTTAADPTSTTATYGATKLKAITSNPQRVYSLTGFSRGTGATAGSISSNGTDGKASITWPTSGHCQSASDCKSTYTFQGWYKESDATNLIATKALTPVLQASTTYTTSDSKWKDTGNVTLYAGWNSGQEVTLPTITKTGCTCKWQYTKSDGTTGTLSSGATYTPGASRVLTGICSANQYTVTLNQNGATTNSSPTSVKVTYLATKLGALTSNPARKYTVSGFTAPSGNNAGGATVSSQDTLTSTYTFNGWYKESGASNKIASNALTPALVASTSYTSDYKEWKNAGNVTLYAGWSSKAVTLPKITKSNYVCGWTTTSSGATSVTYASGASFTPTANTKLYGVCRTKKISDISTLQGMNTTICKNTSTGTEVTLTDTRDDKSYTVRKLKTSATTRNGDCWMTKNLALQGSKKLTSSDSQVSADWTLAAQTTGTWCTSNDASCYEKNLSFISSTASYGGYYNYYTATAGTGKRDTTGNASSSICPKGMHLPSQTEMQNMFDKYNTLALLTDANGPRIVKAGSRKGGSVDNAGKSFSVHTRTALAYGDLGNTNTWYMYTFRLYYDLDAGRVVIDDYDKNRGMSIRCLTNAAAN